MWARCADAFSPDAAARLFGIISAGATSGQLAGSLITMAVAGSSASAASKGAGSSNSGGSGLHHLMLLSALLLYLAGVLQAQLPTPTHDKEKEKGRLLASKPQSSEVAASGLGPPTSGAGWVSAMRGGVVRVQESLSGFGLISASPYLQLVCGYLLMTYVVGELKLIRS